MSRFGHHSTGFTSFYRISWDFTMVLAVEPPLLQRGTDRLFSSLGRYRGRNNRPRNFLSISFHLRILRSVQKCGFYPPSHEYFTPGYRCFPGVKRTVSYTVLISRGGYRTIMTTYLLLRGQSLRWAEVKSSTHGTVVGLCDRMAILPVGLSRRPCNTNKFFLRSFHHSYAAIILGVCGFFLRSSSSSSSWKILRFYSAVFRRSPIFISLCGNFKEILLWARAWSNPFLEIHGNPDWRVVQYWYYIIAVEEPRVSQLPNNKRPLPVGTSPTSYYPDTTAG